MNENKMSEKEIHEAIMHVKSMSQVELARLWRFAPTGHPYFDNSLPIFPVFKERFFDHFGGFTPEINKLLGI